MSLESATFKELLLALEEKHEHELAASSRKSFRKSSIEEPSFYLQSSFDVNKELSSHSCGFEKISAGPFADSGKMCVGPSAPLPTKPNFIDVRESGALPFLEDELSAMCTPRGSSQGNSLEQSVVATASRRSTTSVFMDFALADVWITEPQELDIAEVVSNSAEMGLRATRSGDLDHVSLRIRRSNLVSDPNSFTRIIWMIVGALLVLYDVILLPLRAFSLQSSVLMEAIDKVILFYFTLDIPASFFVGYTDKSGELVMTLRKVVNHYLRSWFVLDLVVVVCDWLVFILTLVDSGDGDIESLGLARAAKAPRVLRVMKSLRVFRFGKFKTLKELVRDMIDSEYLSLAVRAFASIMLIVLLNHVLACSWYFLGTHPFSGSHGWVEAYTFAEDSVAFKYWTCMHWAITQFTPGSMSLKPQNTQERMMNVFVLLFGMIIFSTFVSSITSGMTRIYNDKKKMKEQVWKLRHYLKQHRVRRELALRVNRYVHLMLASQRGFIQGKDVELLQLLSRPLHVELVTAIHQRFLIVHPLLERLELKDRAVLRKLCDSAVNSMHLASSDTLFSVGGRCANMFFLTAGLLTYDPQRQGCVAVPVYKGLWFCEAVLWTRWVHRGSMRAKLECELIGLVAVKFQDIVSQECVDWQLPRAYATAFVKALKYQQEIDGNNSLNDLQVELLDDMDIVSVLHGSQPELKSTHTRATLTRGFFKFTLSLDSKHYKAKQEDASPTSGDMSP